VEERSERGRAFHVDAAADWKDRSPMVERIVLSEDEAKLASTVYIRRKRTSTKMSCTLALSHGGTGTQVPQAGM